MSETTQLPKREELPEELTWDLTKIFSSDQEFDEKYQELTEELKNSDQYKGTLAKGATEFLNALEFVLDVYRKVELIYVYAHLKMTKIQQIRLIKRYMREQEVYFLK